MAVTDVLTEALVYQTAQSTYFGDGSFACRLNDEWAAVAWFDASISKWRMATASKDRIGPSIIMPDGVLSAPGVSGVPGVYWFSFADVTAGQYVLFSSDFSGSSSSEFHLKPLVFGLDNGSIRYLGSRTVSPSLGTTASGSGARLIIQSAPDSSRFFYIQPFLQTLTLGVAEYDVATDVWSVEDAVDVKDLIAPVATLPGFPIHPTNPGLSFSSVAFCRWGAASADGIALQGPLQYNWDDGSMFGQAAQYRAIVLLHRVGPEDWVLDELIPNYVSAGDEPPLSFEFDRRYSGGWTAWRKGIAVPVLFSTDDTDHRTWHWTPDWVPGNSFGDYEANFTVEGGPGFEYTSESGASSTWSLDASGFAYCSAGSGRCFAMVERDYFYGPWLEGETGPTFSAGVGFFMRATEDFSSYFWVDKTGFYFRENGVDTQLWNWGGTPVPANGYMAIDALSYIGVYSGGGSVSYRQFYIDKDDPDPDRAAWCYKNEHENRHGFFWDQGVANPGSRWTYVQGAQTDVFGRDYWVETVATDGTVVPYDITPTFGVAASTPAFGNAVDGSCRASYVESERTGWDPVATWELQVESASSVRWGVVEDDSDIELFGSTVQPVWVANDTGVFRAVMRWPSDALYPAVQGYWMDKIPFKGELKSSRAHFWRPRA